MLLFYAIRESAICLHLGYSDCSCRAHAEAALAKYALACLVRIRLAVDHSKYTLRADIYALLAALAFLRIYRNHIH